MSTRRHLVLLAAAGLAALAANAQTPDCLAHWDFENRVGKGAVGPSSGELIGVAGDDFVQPGLYGTAALFDNGKCYVKAPHSGALSLGDDFTIVCVIKPFSVGGFRTIIWKGDRTVAPEAINYYVDLRDGQLEFKTKDAEGNWIVCSTAPVIQPHQWYLLMLSYTDGDVSAWVNGRQEAVRVSEDGVRGTKLVENRADVMIGAGANTREVTYAFHGLLDEIRILDGARQGFSDSELDDWQARLDGYDAKVRTFQVDRLAARLEEVKARLHGADDTARAVEIENALTKLRSLSPEHFSAELTEAQGRVEALAFRAFFRRQKPEEHSTFAMRTLATWQRVVQRPDFYTELGERTGSAEIAAARNESEGFQVLLIGNPDADVEDVSVAVEGLRCGENTIAAEQIEWGWMKAIRSETPDIPVDFTGPIPDAIMEDVGGVSGDDRRVTIPRAGFVALYFRIHVPEDAVPGLYEGRITVGPSREHFRIRLRLRVHAFTLPQRPSLRMAFSFFESYYRDWYGWENVTPKRRRYVQEFLKRYRIPLNNIYSGRFVNPPVEALREFKESTNFVTSQYTAADVREAGDLENVVARYRDALEAASEAGLEPFFYVYTYDEVTYNAKGISGARQLTDALRQAWPGVKLMQTSFPEPEIRDLFNVWIPNFYHFASSDERAILDALRERGDEIWWYAADAPKHPCPNFFLDYPPFDCRIVGTLSHLYDVKGILYWCINREWKTNLDIRELWPETEWKPYIFHIHHGTRKYKNGMGNLVYPGPNGQLYSSLRLENLRDGIEDFEYLALLKEGVGRLRRRGDAPELLEEATALLEIPDAVATAVNDYSLDPTHLMEYRRRVAAMLDRLKAHLDG